jgi:hypothetical protein
MTVYKTTTFEASKLVDQPALFYHATQAHDRTTAGRGWAGYSLETKLPDDTININICKTLYCWWSSTDRQCAVDHIEHCGAYVERLMFNVDAVNIFRND